MHQNQKELIEQVNRAVKLDDYVSLHWREIVKIKKLLRAASRKELEVILGELLDIHSGANL